MNDISLLETNKPLCIIDGDLIAFKASAVGEERSIVCYYKPYNTILESNNRTEFKSFLADNPHLPEYKYWIIEDKQTVTSPIENCFHTVKSMIGKITEACGTDRYIVVLSGDDNFRDNIPLPSKYKGSREGGIRPLLLKDIKEYMIQYHGAEVEHGWEADDRISSEMYRGAKEGKKIVGCTTDKDAKGCEGWLYNWDKMSEPIYIKGFGSLELSDGKQRKLSGQGRVWMYAQSILGDKVDEYKPSELSGKQFGDVACYNLLVDCKNDKEALQAIYNKYKQWYPTPVTYKAWNDEIYTKTALEIWQMYWDCCRMRRWKDDVIDLKDVLTKTGIEI